MQADKKLRAKQFIRPAKFSTGRPLRVMLLISLAFILKTVVGCVDPFWDFDFSFNKITVGNLDNTGIYPAETGDNTMYSAAVAFNVTLSDETFLASGIHLRSDAGFTGIPGFTRLAGFSGFPGFTRFTGFTGFAGFTRFASFTSFTGFTGFTTVSAMSPESRYYPRHRITEISIVTLEDMSPAIPAGTEVTGLFVAHLPHFITRGFLYLNAGELPSALDQDFYPDEPEVSFQLFCKEDIAGDVAQFLITVTLSDESTLSATTSPVTLIRNK